MSNSASRSASPLVSIVVPTYNYGRFIGPMLESVLAQTYLNWECIIVDDGSTDDTSEVVACFAARDKRIRYIKQKNQGQPAALNTGLRSFTGQYLQILDSDDLLETRKLEKHLEYLEGHPEVSIVYGGVRFFRGENVDERLHAMWGEDRPWMPEVSGAGSEILAYLVRNNIMTVNTPLVRRRTVKAIGFFDDRLVPLQDWDYWIRCAAAGERFEHFDPDGTLALVRAHSASISRNRRLVNRAVSRLRKKMRGTIKEEKLLELNRELALAHTAMVRQEELDHAIGHLKKGRKIKGALLFAGLGIRSRSLREFAKMFFCAFAAPLVPQPTLDRFTTIPASRTVANILRYYLYGSA